MLDLSSAHKRGTLCPAPLFHGTGVKVDLPKNGENILTSSSFSCAPDLGSTSPVSIALAREEARPVGTHGHGAAARFCRTGSRPSSLSPGQVMWRGAETACCLQLSASVLRAVLIHLGTWITSPMVAEEDYLTTAGLQQVVVHRFTQVLHSTLLTRPHFTP